MYRQLLIAIILIISSSTYAQNSKRSFWGKFFENNSTKIEFRQINHNIVIPARINDSDTLWFILDTGLKTSLITELTKDDSLTINYAKKIQLHGLGEGEPVEAYTSFGNDIHIGNIHLKQQKVNVLLEDLFYLSKKAGTKINGILGATIFERFVVEINYSKDYVIFHKPESYEHKHNKKTICLPLEFINKKPYIHTWITDFNGNRIKVKLLIDTGASLALWLQENEQISIPEKNVYNILGQGLSGDIYGKIGRIKNIEIGKYILKEPIASFPDTSSLHLAIQNDHRNGSLGGDLLRRFNVIIDYPNKRICFKRNRSFKKEFTYNNSGIDIETPFPNIKVYAVSYIMKGSPAEAAGIRIGDQLIRIDGKNTFDLTLKRMYKILSSTRKRNLKIRILRDGKFHNITLKTKKLI